jgi:hypothetical protein
MRRHDPVEIALGAALLALVLGIMIFVWASGAYAASAVHGCDCTRPVVIVALCVASASFGACLGYVTAAAFESGRDEP